MLAKQNTEYLKEELDASAEINLIAALHFGRFLLVHGLVIAHITLGLYK